MSDQADRRGASSLLRRWGGRLGRGLLTFIGLLLVLLLVGYGWLQSEPGSRWLKARIEVALDRALAGQVTIGELGPGLLQSEATRVVLRAPDGSVVAEAGRVRARIDPFGLLRGRLDLALVEVTGLHLRLESSENGLNLARAVEPEGPEEPPLGPPSSSYLPFALQVDAVRLRDSRFSLRQKGEEPTVSIDGLQASGWVDVEEDRLRGAIRIDAQPQVPRLGPVAIAVDGGGKGARWDASVRVDLDEGRLLAEGWMDAVQAAVTIEQLHLPPALLKKLVPDLPLQVPVDATGVAALRDDQVTFALAPRLGTGAGRLDGVLDLEAAVLERLRFAGSGFDLAQLLPGGPSSEVGFRLEASGVRAEPAGLEGRFQLEVEPSRIGAARTGFSRLTGTLEAGGLQLAPSVVRLPGAEVQVSGSASPGALALEGTAGIADLGATLGTVGALLGEDLPRASGHGRLDFGVQGPLSRPAVRVEGRFPRAVVEGQRAEGIVLSLHLPDPTNPFALEGELRAATLEAGGLPLTRVRARVRRRVLTLRVEGPRASGLRLRAGLEPDARALVLRRMVIQLPGPGPAGKEAGQCWELGEPARVALLPDGLSVRSLALRSGDQTVRLDGSSRGERFEATVRVDRLDLADLSESLLPPSLQAAGRLSARIDAQGRPEAPRVAAHLAWEDAALREVRARSLVFDGRWSADRAEGRVDADRLAFRDVVLDDVRLAGSSGSRGTSLQMEAQAGEARSTLRLDVGRTLHQLLREPLLPRRAPGQAVDLRPLSRLPFTLVARLDRLPVQLPETLREAPATDSTGKVPGPEASANPAERGVGLLSLQADLRGTVLDPRGRLVGQLDGLPQGPATRVQAELELGEASVRTRLAAEKEERRVVELRGEWGAPLSAVVNRARRERAPIELTGRIEGLDLEDLAFLLTPMNGAAQATALQVPPLRWAAAPDGPPPGRPSPLAGELDGAVDVSGSLASPRVRFQASVPLLRVDGATVGPTRVTAGYAQRRAELQVEAGTPDQGRLSLRGTARPDLSAAGLRRGVRPGRVPFEAELVARRVNVRPLSRLLPEVRAISGALDGTMKMTGPLVQLDARGRLELTGGSLALAGYGEYQELHLLVSGDQDRLTLHDLSAEAGSGDVRVRGEALRQEGGYALRLEVKARELPVVDEDQLQGWVSARATGQGRVVGEQVTIPEVRLSDAEFRLPPSEGKEIQPLDRPESIVLLRGEEPIERVPEAVGGSGEVPPTEPYTGLRVAMGISAPKDIRVFGDDGLQALLRLSPDFRVRLAETATVYGQVTVLRGEFNALGRYFQVQEGSTARFQGDPDRPRVDATAVYEDPREDLTVYLQVRGEGENLRLTVRSEPPLPESEIYNVLATGQRELEPGERQGFAGGAAASLAGSFLAGQLESAFGPVLPFQVLSIQAGQSLGAARVQAGRYLSPRLYIGYLARLGLPVRSRENANELDLEYQLSQDWSLEASYGDAYRGDANLVWQNQY